VLVSWAGSKPSVTQIYQDTCFAAAPADDVADVEVIGSDEKSSGSKKVTETGISGNFETSSKMGPTKTRMQTGLHSFDS
jgi:hypothetical protein